MNPDGTKLSKRQGDIQIAQYKNSGIFPLALINYIVNSGGGFDKDSTQKHKSKSYTLSELMEQVSYKKKNTKK